MFPETTYRIFRCVKTCWMHRHPRPVGSWEFVSPRPADTLDHGYIIRVPGLLGLTFWRSTSRNGEPPAVFFLDVEGGRIPWMGLPFEVPGAHGTRTWIWHPSLQFSRTHVPENEKSVQLYISRFPNSRCASEATPLRTTISRCLYANLAKTPQS